MKDIPTITDLTLEEWKNRGAIDTVLSCLSGFDAVNQEGSSIRYKMTFQENWRLIEHLGATYNDAIDEEVSRLKKMFDFTWRQASDPIKINREIEYYEYCLYPEKFASQEIPKSIDVILEIRSTRTQETRNAYAKLLELGRQNCLLPKDPLRSKLIEVEAMKQQLDWLIGFRKYLDSESNVDSSTINSYDVSLQSNPKKPTELNEVQESILAHLMPFEDNIYKPGEYQSLVHALESYFKNQPVNLSSPVFVRGSVKTTLAKAFGNIYKDLRNGPIPLTYLQFIIHNVSQFANEKIGVKTFNTSNLSKMM